MVMGSPEKVQGAVEFINNLLEGANVRQYLCYTLLSFNNLVLLY